MPVDSIGFSFQPGTQAQRPGQSGGGRAGGMTPQQAVRILSLRVPERPSPTAIAPLPLLQSQGSRAPGAQGLDSMIAALMQSFGRGGGQQGAGGSYLPTPSGPGPFIGGPDDIWRAPDTPERPRTPDPIPEPDPFQRRPVPDGEWRPKPPNNPPPPVVTPGDPGPRPEPIPDAPPSGPQTPIDMTPEPPPSLFDDNPAPFNWHEMKRGLFDEYDGYF